MKILKYVVLLMILIYTPNVLAEISLNPLPKSTYNLGDQIDITGIISGISDVNLLTLNLGCDDTSIPLRTVFFPDIKETEFFDASLLIPISSEGNCNIIATIGDETISSETFTITKELKGTFSINPVEIQLGDKINLDGTANKLDNSMIDGFATIYFKKDSDVYFADSVKITDSNLDYQTTLRSIPEGNYNIEILVNDIYGNQHLFTGATELKVHSNLLINLEIDKTQILPGDKIKISGSAEKIIGNLIKEGQVTIKIDSKKYETTIENSNFKYELGIPQNIKSNYHDLKVSVKDVDGNYGEKIENIYVIAVPKRLNVESEKTVYNPKELVKINSFLYDQASDLVVEKVDIEIFDTENNKVLEQSILTNEVIEYQLEDYALPGNWKIKANYKDLSTETTFRVETIQELEITLTGQTLKARNIGNIDYIDNLIINAKSEKKEYEIVKRTDLKPNEEIYVSLFREVKPGTYNLYILNTDQSFNDITVVDERSFTKKTTDYLKEITGSVVATPGSNVSKTPIIVILLILIALILFIGMNRFKNVRRSDLIRKRERKEAKKIAKNLKTKIKPRIFGKSDESDVEDFKARILKDIEEYKDQEKSDYKEDKRWPEIKGTKQSWYEKSKEKKEFDSFDRPLEPKKKDKVEEDEKDDNRALFSMFK